MKSYGNFLYSELKLRGVLENFKPEDGPWQNMDTLDGLLMDMNVTKSSASEVERSYPGSILHLCYLLQTENDVDMGLCGFFKVWLNRDGWQYGCYLDKGKGQRIQVHCHGKYPHRCERKDEYAAYQAAQSEANSKTVEDAIEEVSSDEQGGGSVS
jgi:hypothetical protein